MALHDMLPENGADHELYGTRLLKLRPLLEELNKGSRVLWLSVYPTFDTATYGWKNNLMYTEKISRYNAIAREVFRYACFACTLNDFSLFCCAVEIPTFTTGNRRLL